MKTLFITRKYPPSRGGMETFSYELLTRFPDDSVHIVESGKNIITSTLLLFFRSLKHLRNIDVIHIGDAVLAPLGAILHLISKKPVVVTVHGLELTSSFGGRLYHACMRWSLPYIARWVAVSEATQSLASTYGIAANKITVIAHGSTPHTYSSEERTRARWYIEKRYPQIQHHSLILSVGRLVERKGIPWFIQNVFASLSSDTVLCIVSDGPERERIQHLIARLNLSNRIFLIGKVTSEELQQWYCAADLFVFPNIPVPYDIEGCGLTPLEAASYGTVVLAARLEGITDAILENKNGILIETLNAPAWIARIEDTLRNPTQRAQDGERFAAYTAEHFSWNAAGQAYRTLFNTL